MENRRGVHVKMVVYHIVPHKCLCSDFNFAFGNLVIPLVPTLKKTVRICHCRENFSYLFFRIKLICWLLNVIFGCIQN